MDKIRKRDMKLSDCNISRTKYNELKYFCLQYGEKKQELHRGYGPGAVLYDRMPRGNRLGNPTEQMAIRKVTLQREVELIEETAEEAAPEIYRWLLKSVTDGIGYDYLDVPMSRNRFYDTRKYFFYLLAQKR